MSVHAWFSPPRRWRTMPQSGRAIGAWGMVVKSRPSTRPAPTMLGRLRSLVTRWTSAWRAGAPGGLQPSSPPVTTRHPAAGLPLPDDDRATGRALGAPHARHHTETSRRAVLGYIQSDA